MGCHRSNQVSASFTGAGFRANRQPGKYHRHALAGENSFGELMALFQQRQLDIPVAGVFALDDFKAASRSFQAPRRLGKILLRND